MSVGEILEWTEIQSILFKKSDEQVYIFIRKDRF